MVVDLSDFDPASIALVQKEKFVVFVLATYGEGDPSDNASQLWEWTTTNTQELVLSDLRYAALGLGNSNYEHYNRVVDVVDKCLQNAGATRLAAVGRADDAAGKTEEHFCGWKEDFFDHLLNEVGIEEKASEFSPGVEVVYDASLEPINLHLGEPVHRNATAGSCTAARMLAIQHARELYSEQDRSCLHIEFDLSKHGEVVYKTGDHLAVWPCNPDEEVRRLIGLLGLQKQKDVPISVNAIDKSMKLPFPSPTTLSALFSHYLEICAPVPFELAATIATYAQPQHGKSWLSTVCGTREAYNDLRSNVYLTLPRLLERASQQDGPATWRNLPLALLLETLPSMRPRYYSISSSSVKSPRMLSITVAVSNDSIRETTETIPGLATNYLLANAKQFHGVRIPSQHFSSLYDLPPSAEFPTPGKIFAHVRHSAFKLPVSASCPIIMLAAGTGIAPFRAFIEERARLAAMGRTVGHMLLFFGCRDAQKDNLYGMELREIEKSMGNSLEIIVAFSRSPDTSRAYIQDKMVDHATKVLEFVDRGANIYVCGKASMARQVSQTMSSILTGQKGFTKARSQEWVKSMKRTNKWQEDVWG